ncbi:porin [Dissulfurimicrobium hydrothermale]|uniref:porin n=1 Tax=Dissulfurimicrobium hydrothermale TaxID=1750598 RepID=UPI001EDB0A24|nr:hypothetical protein [Dissulfurimicrobium hydrothermale]UKL13621.1 hypothetical protein LGS26_09165 [Dissulfurimicrobium hydrothermale]
MGKRIYLVFFVLLCVSAWILALSLQVRADESGDIKALKAQVRELMQRIDQLEKNKKEAPPSNLNVYWNDGFRIEYKDPKTDNEYKFRFRTGIQPRYTYVFTDDTVAKNTENYSNFNFRRIRFFVDGSAPNKDWEYFVHVQLEPQSAVNIHDATIQWQKYKFARVQLGRMKIPYSIEFWQSGFMQNGADRTIFTGDSEVTKDQFGQTTYNFPSNNAPLNVSNQLLANGFPAGGMELFRSQGINVNGYVDMLGQKDFLAYWLGVYNGRDTRGFTNTDSNMLYVARIGINFLPGSDPRGPMGPSGFNHYFMQGDYGYNTKPLAALVLASFTNRDRVNNYFDTKLDTSNNNAGTKKTGIHDVENYGFDSALLFRYLGFSTDLEAGWEEFKQDPGDSKGLEQTWDRWAARANVGYFIVPKKWEAVFKAAYFERINSNNLEKSLRSGLGLVKLSDGYAVEDNLQQYIFGVNYYIHGFNQYVSADVRWMRRNFNEISVSEAKRLGFTYPISHNPSDEDDVGVRVQYQYFF